MNVSIPRAVLRRRGIGFRNVAQFGRALDLGSRGRRFESCHSDDDAKLVSLMIITATVDLSVTQVAATVD